MACYLENHKELLKPIIYYGISDYVGLQFAQNVIDHLDSLESEADSLNCEVVGLYSLYQFLWISSLKKLSEEIDTYNLPGDCKSRIKRLANGIRPKNGSFVAFIKGNYRVVFDKNAHKDVVWRHLFQLLLEFIYGKFARSFGEEVFLFLEKTYPSWLISDFEICENYYRPKEKDSNFESLFAGLENLDAFCDSFYIYFLNKIGPYYKAEIVRKKADLICSRALRKIKEVIDNDNEESAEGTFQFEDYYKLAYIFKIPCFSEYSQLRPKVVDCLDQYLDKHGVSFELEPVNLSSIISELKKQKDPLKFLQFTHVPQNGKASNHCDYILELEPPNELTEDFAKSWKPRSNRYPYYKQDNMELFLLFQRCTLEKVITDNELFADLYRYTYALCDVVEREYFQNKIQISDEYCGAFEVLKNIFTLRDSGQDNGPLIKALENGLCVNLCGTIEKILRNVLLKEGETVNDRDPDSYTLGSIFGRSGEMKSVSPGLKYFLEFYLSKESNDKIRKVDRPGKDIRNTQMHNHDGKYAATTYENCLLLFYFALSLLGDLFLATLKINPPMDEL